MSMGTEGRLIPGSRGRFRNFKFPKEMQKSRLVSGTPGATPCPAWADLAAGAFWGEGLLVRPVWPESQAARSPGSPPGKGRMARRTPPCSSPCLQAMPTCPSVDIALACLRPAFLRVPPWPEPLSEASCSHNSGFPQAPAQGLVRPGSGQIPFLLLTEVHGHLFAGLGAQ